MLAITFGLWSATGIRAQTNLIMFDATGCPYCALWEEEIGPIYPKTEESARAPLIHIDIYERIPDNIQIGNAIVFTPTFVLVNDGIEVGRITGYPGQDFFWGLLDRMLADLPEAEKEGS